MSETTPVEIAVPEAVHELRLLEHVDYEDAFVVDTPRVHDPEWWMRAFMEDAPRWFQVPWLFGLGRGLLGAQLGPLAGSPDHVLGWKVVRDEPEAFVIGLESSRGLTVRLVALTPPGQAIVATQIRLSSRYARAVWPTIRPGHRFFLPYLLGRAATGDGGAGRGRG